MRRRLVILLLVALSALAAVTTSATSTPTTKTSTTGTTTTATKPTPTSTTKAGTTSTTTTTTGKSDTTPSATPTTSTKSTPAPVTTSTNGSATTTTSTAADGTTSTTTNGGAVPATVAKTQAELDAEAAAADAEASAAAASATGGSGAAGGGDSGAPVTDPTLPEAPTPPPVHALSWMVVDASDGTEVAGHAVTTKRAIASLTKLMTALLVVERTRGSELVPIDRHAVESDGGSSLSMQPGQSYRLDDLLDATLVHSANDGAVALAEYVGGGGAEGEATFRKMMNDRAAALGMADTRYTSVNGLDGLSGSSVPATRSTARDMIRLAKAFYTHPRLRHAVALHGVDFQRPGQPTLTFPNRNTLIGSYAGVDGVKTGHTDEAGYNLLTHYHGRDGSWWVIVLGDRTEALRDGDTRALLDWARELRPQVSLAQAGDEVGEAPVDDGTSRLERLYLSTDISARIRLGARVTDQLVVASRLHAPLRAGDEVGRFTVLADGKVVGRSRVYVDRAVHKPTRSQRWHRLLHRLPHAWSSGIRPVRHQVRRFTDYWGI